MENNGSQMITTAGSSHHGQTPMTERLELCGAALKNNWEAAEILIRRNPSLVRTPITNGGGTALHIAAIEGHQAFVTKLLQIMEVDDLKILNANGCTSLWSAAAAGHIRIAQIMVEASSTLPTIKGENGVYPLYMAAMQGFKEMADFLYPKSDFGSWTEQEKINLLTTAIGSKLYGLAKSIVEQHKFAMHEDSNGEAPLLVLARDPLAFRCIRQGIWAKIMRNAKTPDENARDDAYQLLDCLWNTNEAICTDIEVKRGVDTTKLFFEAADYGNDDFLVEVLRRDYNFLCKINESRHSIFHIAVKHRYVRVFNLIYEFVGIKDLISTYIDTDGNNLLHLAGTLTPQAKKQLNCIPGAALQMQREVLWFKVFPVSEAVATLSSLTSVLMFMSILTSRYSDDDFLKTLPFWLVVGVASLFVSIAAMMVAFCSCLLFLEHGWVEVTLLLGFFASVPTIFLVLNYPSLVAILRGTYSCTWLFRSYDRLH